MIVTFVVHLEPAEETGVVWWAETSALPGLSVAADTLEELRALALEAVDLHIDPKARSNVRFELAAQPTLSAGDGLRPTVDGRPIGSNDSTDVDARRAIMTPA